MVEQEAVNFEVAGSSPASGAKSSSHNVQLYFSANLLYNKLYNSY